MGVYLERAGAAKEELGSLHGSDGLSGRVFTYAACGEEEEEEEEIM
jgi:hypothetical protein